MWGRYHHYLLPAGIWVVVRWYPRVGVPMRYNDCHRLDGTVTVIWYKVHGGNRWYVCRCGTMAIIDPRHTRVLKFTTLSAGLWNVNIYGSVVMLFLITSARRI